MVQRHYWPVFVLTVQLSAGALHQALGQFRQIGKKEQDHISVVNGEGWVEHTSAPVTLTSRG